MATKHKGPADEVRALDAFVKLMRASDALSSRVHRHLAQDDLTVSQFGALEALHHLGPMCQKVLGEKLLKTGGNITMVVTNLEKRGLVRRERMPENRKYVTVHLTDEGRRLIRRVFPRHVSAIVREFEVLPAAEQESLARLCRALGLGARAAPA
jgi:MarR family 2-MHQ and catechol resistance regulon transcriptional repressor